MANPGSAIESVFKRECGRILASLIRIAGSFDLAEEALQEAFAAALSNWPCSGLPKNPGAWIMTAAQRRLIDGLRKERTRRHREDALQRRMESGGAWQEEAEDWEAGEFRDDRLRLIFTCCHPALHPEARVALTLRTLGGLSTAEIAKAFLVPEPTLAQRLVRAKRKIQEARIPYEVPARDRLPERLAAVQSVLYLIFNEGYAGASGDELVRNDLCDEAIRLGRTLCELLPNDAGSKGLLALMLLQHSRRKARVREGQLITLDQQDRSLWDRAAIEEGVLLVEQALQQGPAGPYQLQAAVAALHSQAATAEETDWPQIAALYQKQWSLTPSPVIALNGAVATAMSGELVEGLAAIDELGRAGSLDRYYLFHAARADLLRRLNRQEEALAAYRKAANLATNGLEVEFLRDRILEVEQAR